MRQHVQNNENLSPLEPLVPLALPLSDLSDGVHRSVEEVPGERVPSSSPGRLVRQSVYCPLTRPRPSASSANAYQRESRTLSPALVTFACDECNTPPPVTSPAAVLPKVSDLQPSLKDEEQRELSSTTMNVIVKVTNPRLILLEDPTTDESRAIVSSCGIEVHYSREHKLFPGVSRITGTQNKELRESLHISLHDHKVFVLRSMLQWHPQSILEPMGMEFNLRRRTVNRSVVTYSYPLSSFLCLIFTLS